jgi:O-antigen/teichoic acid export membrane protein
MNLGEKLLRGSTLNLLDMLLKTAALFVMMPLMKGRLGLEGWGTWLLAMSMVNWFVLLDAGATFAGTRFLSSAWGRGDSARAAAVLLLLARFFVVVATVALAICLILVGLSLAAPGWLEDEAALIAGLTGVCGMAVSFRFYLRKGPIVLRARLRYDLLAGISIVRVALQNGLIAWLLLTGQSLWSMAGVYLLCDMLETILQWMAARRLDLPKPETVDAASLPALSKEMRAFSILMVVAVIGETLRMQVGPALLGALAGVASVPVFTVGTRLITMIEDVVNSLFGGQLLAAFSHIEGTGGQAALSPQLLRVNAVTASFSAFAVSGAVFFGHPFLDRLLGADMTASYEVFLLFAPGFLFRFMQYPAHSALYSLGRQKSLILMTLVGATLGSILSVPAVGRWGASGIAGAFGLEMLVCYVVVLPAIVCRALNLTLSAYLLRSLLLPAFLTLVPLSLYGWWAQQYAAPDYLVLALLAAGHAMIFFSVAPYLVLSKSDRTLLFSKIPFFRPI